MPLVRGVSPGAACPGDRRGPRDRLSLVAALHDVGAGWGSGPLPVHPRSMQPRSASARNAGQGARSWPPAERSGAGAGHAGVAARRRPASTVGKVLRRRGHIAPCRAAPRAPVVRYERMPLAGDAACTSTPRSWASFLVSWCKQHHPRAASARSAPPGPAGLRGRRPCGPVDAPPCPRSRRGYAEVRPKRDRRRRCRYAFGLDQRPRPPRSAPRRIVAACCGDGRTMARSPTQLARHVAPAPAIAGRAGCADHLRTRRLGSRPAPTARPEPLRSKSLSRTE